jgi:hypothetical protein
MKKTNARWTIRELLQKRHLIEFPEYQREPTVWNLEKKQRLIDSILRDFDIASIYLFKKEDATYGYAYDCIDGRQRINAILSYLEENKDDKEDDGFHLTMANEIYDDLSRFGEINNKRFKNLPQEWQDRIWNYPINVVEIDRVENEEELNLLFLRLQLGQVLNAGEKLHAMTGEMRDYIFNDIGGHDFLKGIKIPYRRYAREQVAAQITLNYFIKNKTGDFHRSRYIDLQEFFKEQSGLNGSDKKLTEEIRQKLDIICKHLRGELSLIGNRAIAVSLFLFVSGLIDEGKESELKQFGEFLVKFLQTLKWQIPKGVQMDRSYHYLLDFQTYVTQAAGEKYAIQNRHDFLGKAFYYYKKNKAIEGDDKYFEHTKQKADKEREKVKL